MVEAEQLGILSNRQFRRAFFMRFISICVIVVGLQTLLSAQRAEFKDTGSLLERVSKGDSDAVLELGNSSDSRNIEILLPLFHDPKYPARESVRKALAKLGEKKALQHYACLSLTDDVDKMPLLIRDDLDYIGGGFTVEIYRQLLDSDPRFIAQIDRDPDKDWKYSDVIIQMPSNIALRSLSKLVPNPPIRAQDLPVFSEMLSEKAPVYKAVWKDWIKNHKAEIEKLPPSAEGIQFDGAYCSELAKWEAKH